MVEAIAKRLEQREIFGDAVTSITKAWLYNRDLADQLFKDEGLRGTAITATGRLLFEDLPMSLAIQFTNGLVYAVLAAATSRGVQKKLRMLDERERLAALMTAGSTIGENIFADRKTAQTQVLALRQKLNRILADRQARIEILTGAFSLQYVEMKLDGAAQHAVNASAAMSDLAGSRVVQFARAAREDERNNRGDSNLGEAAKTA